MTCGLAHALLASMFIATATTLAGAQGSATSSISGVVKDSGGGVIPGASVVVTSNATDTRFETITNSTGAYSVPALPAGTYTVSASLEGFKTAVITDVRVQLGIPTTVNTTLDVGNLVESITVTGASAELINTQTCGSWA